jgi:alkyl sulfatase BDS1-like metallo-beta-lactamase superfamily hydrolase
MVVSNEDSSGRDGRERGAPGISAVQTEPVAAVVRANAGVVDALPFDDHSDFENADRGFVKALAPCVVTNQRGRTVWNNDSYAFLAERCPSTVNPSLWRQSQLNAKQGLYEIAPGFFQIRGLDLSNMTVIEGDAGIIVIDPLISAETAAAGLALYRSHRGDRPVTGLIYTHSHVDHFGGTYGVVTAEDVTSGRCPVVAPSGFLEHAVAENIYAGTAMSRRAAFMYGSFLPRGPMGQVGSGLGQTTSLGSTGVIPPTLLVDRTGQIETIDGVTFEFQLTPGTEAPSEMNFYFPDHRLLCMAENATHTMHNILTLRGALVRDSHVWAGYITESINKYARSSDVVFSSHHWPVWGTDNVVEYLALQRDMYAYLHDQTLRMLNQGLVGGEIAEEFTLPPALENNWATRGYYGSVSHNVKAIYQRYMGWFDGNPAHLWEHPPVESAKRHVAAMGGADAVLSQAERAYGEGDFRWAAQILNYLVFSDPDNDDAKNLQASTFEQLAYGSENATWRNFYLSGAHELRNGPFRLRSGVIAPTMLAALTTEQIFDTISLRIDGPRAWDLKSVTDWKFTDTGQRWRTELRNGVLVHYARAEGDGLPGPDSEVVLTKDALGRIILQGADAAELIAAGAISGDLKVLADLAAVLSRPDPNFPLVTP